MSFNLYLYWRSSLTGSTVSESESLSPVPAAGGCCPASNHREVERKLCRRELARGVWSKRLCAAATTSTNIQRKKKCLFSNTQEFLHNILVTWFK